jgi:nicotinamide mononucleotide adenylyltransferase
MRKFDQIIESVLTEARKPFDPSDYNTDVKKKEVAFIPGRFQPMHLGHLSLVKNANYPVVIGIVKGKNTSKDKDKNPFDFNLQKKIIEAMKNKNIVDVIEVPNVNIVQIASDLRDKGYEVKEMWAGTDRVKSYSAMAERYAEPMNWDIKVNEIKRDSSDKGIAGISATKVRNALKDGNFDEAARMMGSNDLPLMKKLQRELI